jgi:hypothetical protein
MPVSDYTPTVADVAAFIRARTRTNGGSEAGTFTPADAAEGSRTRPTEEQVTALIGEVAPDIVGAFPADIPDAPGDDPDLYRKAVARIWALGAALQVELTYFPEQVSTNRSPYSQLLALYNDRFKRMAALIARATGSGDLDGPGGEPGGSLLPSGGGFPLTAIGMEHPW